MKLIIDIPEELYNHTQKYEVGGFNQENDTKLFIAIKNGTPLPKGHGRLIDADALIDSLDASDRDIYCQAVIEEDASTIIEADKAESEE